MNGKSFRIQNIPLVVLSFVFLNLISGPLLAQDDLPERDLTAIHQVMSMQEDAWNSGDIEQFMEGYWKSEKLVFVGRRGPTYGWKNTMDNYKKGYPDRRAMGTLSFKILKTERIDRKTARLIGRFDLARKDGDLGGYFTLLWKKIQGKWVIIGDHTSAE